MCSLNCARFLPKALLGKSAHSSPMKLPSRAGRAQQRIPTGSHTTLCVGRGGGVWTVHYNEVTGQTSI